VQEGCRRQLAVDRHDAGAAAHERKTGDDPVRAAAAAKHHRFLRRHALGGEHLRVRVDFGGKLAKAPAPDVLDGKGNERIALAGRRKIARESLQGLRRARFALAFDHGGAQRAGHIQSSRLHVS
jgi:hypothetical protein